MRLLRSMFRGAPRWRVLSNLVVRAMLVYFGGEAIHATLANPRDRRFAGKGIALRNALLVGAFSLLLPVLYQLGPKRRPFPWIADALLITVPVADMAGNSFDLYNREGGFDVITHCYGTGVVAGLVALAARDRGVRPPLARWLLAAGTTTFFHVLLEIQEYWTDVWFGTRNVAGLEDTEGDLLAGICGAVSGVAIAEALTGGRVGRWVAGEAGRLSAALDPLVSRGCRRRAEVQGDRVPQQAVRGSPVEAVADRPLEMT